MKADFWKRFDDALSAMGNPVKSEPAFKYKYETLEGLLAIVKPAMASQGLRLMQYITVVDKDSYLRTAILDTRSDGEPWVLDTRPIAMGANPQANGSAETYARRYAIKTICGLVGVDDDGAAAVPQQQNQPARTASAPQASPQQAPQYPYYGGY